MKKILTLSILYFISFMGFSQNGEITYSLLLYKVTKIDNNVLKKQFDVIVKNENIINAKLYFNSSEMKFEIAKPSSLSIDDYENTLRIADNEGVFYKKQSDDLIYKLIAEKKRYNDIICTRKFFTEWKLYDEKKIIAGYECLKAECTLGTDYGDGEIIYSYPLTAWYCPEIKNSIGPKGIGGLPGMILELNQNLVTFKATKVNLNASKKDISIPKLKIIKEMDLIKYIQSSNDNK